MKELLSLDNVLAVAVLVLSWMWMRYTRSRDRERDKEFAATFEKIQQEQSSRSVKCAEALEKNTEMLGRNVEVLAQLKEVIGRSGSREQSA